MSETVAGVGTSFAMANVGAEELLATTQLLGEKSDKLQGSEAATALNAIVIKLQTAGAEFKKYGIEGIAATLETDGFSAALRKAAPLLSDNEALVKVFGSEHANAVKILLSGTDALDEYTKKITGTNIASEQALAGTEKLSRQYEILSANIKNIAAASLDSFVSSTAVDGLQAINDYLKAFQTDSATAEAAASAAGATVGGATPGGAAPGVRPLPNHHSEI
jgi:TP901 family phage tail tape measure protein